MESVIRSYITHRPIAPRRHIIKNENRPTQLVESEPSSSSGAASHGPAISGVVVLLSVGRGRIHPPSPAIIHPPSPAFLEGKGNLVVSSSGRGGCVELTVGSNGVASPAGSGVIITGLAFAGLGSGKTGVDLTAFVRTIGLLTGGAIGTGGRGVKLGRTSLVRMIVPAEFGLSRVPPVLQPHCIKTNTNSNKAKSQIGMSLG